MPTSSLPQPSPLLRFFDSAHVPEKFRAISRKFQVLAEHTDRQFHSHPEKLNTLRQLLAHRDRAFSQAMA